MVRGADLTGPRNSSGTSSTISATRMMAPVNRSFTRPPTIGAKPRKASTADAARGTPQAAQQKRPALYPKPLERRAHRVERAAHEHPVPGARLGARPFASAGYRVGELHGRAWLPQALRELRSAAAARAGQRAHDPVIDDARECRGDRGGVL